jgi:hypothetical protein
MSFATLERAVLKETRAVLNNPKIKQRDIIEWSTGDITPSSNSDEIVVRLPELSVNVIVFSEHDRRGK